MERTKVHVANTESKEGKKVKQEGRRGRTRGRRKETDKRRR